MRPLRPLVAAVVLACLWTALREGVPRASVRPAPAGGTGAWAQPRYSDLDRVEASLSAWAESDEERIRLHRLASSRDRRPLLCLELAPGGLDRAPDAPRPWTLLVVGGLDGRSLAGCHAAMLAAERLVKALPALRRDVRVLLVPLGAPDALARAAHDASRLPTGRNTRPIDDDLDGAEGEDPPDDLDGDGLVLEMLVEDPDGPWALTEKPRRLVPAGPGAGARYAIVPEGRDDDRDGRFNEDGPGGVAYDVHFPAGWRGPAERPGDVVVRPLAESVPRALARFAAQERVDLAVFLEGNHGDVTFAAGRPLSRAEDEAALRASFGRATGRDLGATPPAPPGGGHMMCWLASALGVPSAQVGVWGPRVAGADGRPIRGADGDALRDSTSIAAWRAWVDEVRGGDGFVHWHPVDAGGGRVAFVGGFEPRIREDPPEDLLDDAIRGVDEFVAGLVEAFPRLDIEVLEVERHGEVVEVSARVVNRGGLGVDFAERADGVTLTLDVEGERAAILGGPDATRIRALAGREASEARTWLVQLPAGAKVTLEAYAEDDRGVVREVRP